MGKTIIRCTTCGGDEWIPRNDNTKKEDSNLKCSKCGALFCAKNRTWSYEK